MFNNTILELAKNGFSVTFEYSLYVDELRITLSRDDYHVRRAIPIIELDRFSDDSRVLILSRMLKDMTNMF